MEFIWYSFALVMSLVLAGMIGPRVHTFRWSKYLVIVGLPLAVILAYAYFVDARILLVYFAACVGGTILEYIVGRAWHALMGHRLWEYWRFAPGGYTSFLIMPLWGVAGVSFFLLGNFVVGYVFA